MLLTNFATKLIGVGLGPAIHTLIRTVTIWIKESLKITNDALTIHWTNKLVNYACKRRMDFLTKFNELRGDIG